MASGESQMDTEYPVSASSRSRLKMRRRRPGTFPASFTPSLNATSYSSHLPGFTRPHEIRMYTDAPSLDEREARYLRSAGRSEAGTTPTVDRSIRRWTGHTEPARIDQSVG